MLRPARTGGLSDAQLLQRFIFERDEAAFEVLVWRHGPKVLGICRRILRHEQDAEDAFQATFLILVHKAASIGKRQAVSCWLYRVAYRVALRARRRAAKRAAREKPVLDVPAAEPALDPLWRDLRSVLDEEVNRLPEKYRAPFVLCYLDGKTNEEAAQALGCPRGTVLSRLAWARKRLRTRLARRGLGLAGALLAAAQAPEAAMAAVPPMLVQSTLKAALSIAAGTTAGIVSGPVAALTQGVLQTMLWTKIKIVASCLVLAGTIALGGIALAQAITTDSSTVGQQGPSPEGGQPIQAQREPVPNEAVAEPQAQNGKQGKDQAPKQDRAADQNAEPKQEEKTHAFEMRESPWSKVFEWYSDVSGLPFVSAHRPTGTVTFVPPKNKRYTLGEITDILNELLLAQRCILVRRAASFTLLPADEAIDPSLVPRVSLSELNKRGRTELVSVVVPLTMLRASDLAPELKKLFGPFGNVVALETTNQLVLQDTAATVRWVHELIQKSEARVPEKKAP
jgi:RNA polymerase sigma factor (sigma-70 family)